MNLNQQHRGHQFFIDIATSLARQEPAAQDGVDRIMRIQVVNKAGSAALTAAQGGMATA